MASADPPKALTDGVESLRDSDEPLLTSDEPGPGCAPVSTPASSEPSPASPANAPAQSDESDASEQALDRVGSRLVRSIFGQLRHLSHADRLHVLMACRGRLAVLGGGGGGERVQLCLTSMRLCQADEGKLSAGAYNRWRDHQPNRDEHPSVQFITDTFDGWRLAKDAAGADVVGSVLARRLLGTSEEFTPAHMIEGLLEYAGTGAPLVYRKYLKWAREQMASASRTRRRYVIAAGTIVKTFGSWTGFVCAAGLAHRLEGDRLSGSLPPGPREAYSMTACVRWLQEAGAGRGGANMRLTAYDDWAMERSRKALAGGEVVFIPRSRSLERIIGSWAECLHAAGLIDDNELELRRQRRGRSMGDRELVTWLARAMADLGPGLTDTDYMRRRAQERRVEFPPQIPTAKAIAKRLGGWIRACQLGRKIVGARASGSPSAPARGAGDSVSQIPGNGNGNGASQTPDGGNGASQTSGGGDETDNQRPSPGAEGPSQAPARGDSAGQTPGCGEAGGGAQTRGSSGSGRAARRHSRKLQDKIREDKASATETREKGKR